MDTDAANSKSRDEITDLLEIARNRPGTNVAKAILAYTETPGPSTLIYVLEEISKNTDYSTDLRVSLGYFLEEFLKQIVKMQRRLVFPTASRVLDTCGKIYGDRVEFMLQVVEQQIASLLISEHKADESTNTTVNNETRKRRRKKLVHSEIEPLSFKMEPRSFKTMSDEKRFSRVGFETSNNHLRTIEHMYLDHTPSHLWKYAPIVDPDNPHEQDEKKNYKLFTYLPEPRYNTLLPDIQFERLNLIKEYASANHDLSDSRHENMSNREYLEEYISLENQMLASRFADITQTSLNVQCDEQANKRSVNCIENSPKRIRLSESYDPNITADESGAILEDTLNTLPLTDASDAPMLSSTLANNETSCFNSTSLDLQQTQSEMESQPTELDMSVANADDSNDAGISMENVPNPLVTAQSFDDEGIVLTDNLEDQNQQRLLSLSPKVLVRDILPGVPDKENLSVRVDSEMLALGGVNEALEEIVEAARKVQFPIILNILNIPKRKLRSERLFVLSQDFKIFMEQRLPSKRVAAPKPPRTVNIPSMQTEGDNELEFDNDFNFLGFRRPTHDSGFDHEDVQAELDVRAIETLPQADDIQNVRDGAQTENDLSLPGIPMDTLETTTLNETTTSLSNIPMDLGDPMDLMDATALNENSGLNGTVVLPEIPPDTTTLATTQHDSGIDVTLTNFESNSDGFDAADTVWDAADDTMENVSSIDEETDAKINEWHRRMAPVLELSHDRQNFSIEDLNKEVIQNCLEHNNETTLGNVLEGKDPTKMSCYFLSALLLTNHGNVALHNPNNYGAIEMDELQIKLLSTELKQVNPEDEIGNANRGPSQSNKPRNTAPQQTGNAPTALRRKSTEPYNDEQPKVKMVRLIQPVPKASVRADDADSGISSLPASISSSFSTDA